MSDMIERVAMRMAQMSKARVAGMHMINALPMDGEENFLDLARAAIEAMREPTLEMRKVCSFTAAEIDYPAMIDAALKD